MGKCGEKKRLFACLRCSEALTFGYNFPDENLTSNGWRCDRYRCAVRACHIKIWGETVAIRSRQSAVIVASALLLSACATNPGMERHPERFTCFALDEPLVAKTRDAATQAEWEWRLAPGLYFSEIVDGAGTYFRAPPGGVYQGRTDRADAPAGPSTHLVSDGGVYLPLDTGVPPRVYRFAALEDAPVKPHPAGADCALAFVVKHPRLSRLAIAMPDFSAPPPELREGATVSPDVSIAAVATFRVSATDAAQIELGPPVLDPAFQTHMRRLENGATEVTQMVSEKFYED